MTLAFDYREEKKGSTSTGEKNFKASEGQVKFYHDLLAQRNMKPDPDHVNWSYQEMHDKINEIKSFRPPSQKQVDTIKELINQLRELGADVALMEDEEIRKLQGGYNGEAGKKIDELKKLLSNYNDKQPMSEKQLDFISKMFLCPDVGFEDYDIPRKLPYEGSEGSWRYPTKEEFEEMINDKMNKKDASAFIDKYRTAFFNWKKTRIAEGQMSYIRTLELRLADIHVPKEENVGVDQDGNINVINKASKESIEDYRAYVQLTEYEILMFSQEQASEYIEQLKSEIENKSLKKFEKEPEIDELRTEDFCLVETMKKVAHNVEAIVGYADEKLHSELYNYAQHHDSIHLTYLIEYILNESIYLGALNLPTNVEEEVTELIHDKVNSTIL